MRRFLDVIRDVFRACFVPDFAPLGDTQPAPVPETASSLPDQAELLAGTNDPNTLPAEPLLGRHEPLGNVLLSNGRKEPFVRISGIAGWPDRLHYFRDLAELKEVLPEEVQAPKVSFTEITRIDFLDATPAETKAFGGYWIRKGRIQLKGGKKLENVFIGANVDLKGEAGQDWNLYSSKPKGVEFSLRLAAGSA